MLRQEFLQQLLVMLPRKVLKRQIGSLLQISVYMKRKVHARNIEASLSRKLPNPFCALFEVVVDSIICRRLLDCGTKCETFETNQGAP